VVLGLIVGQPSLELFPWALSYENISLPASRAASNERRDGQKIARLNVKVETWPSRVTDNGFSM